MNSYCEKVVEFARKYESKGMIETAINLYEEAGEANEMYVREALNLSMGKGWLKRCINLFRKYGKLRIAKTLEESVRDKSNPIQTKLLDEAERKNILENREDIPLGLKKTMEDRSHKVIDKKSFKSIDENKIKNYVNKFHYQN